MRFEGTRNYVASEDLKIAVNAAITLERPLLVKGEPGTGKTVLAQEIAKALDAPLIEWHIKSTTKALQGLYEYDAVARLRDGQLGDARVKDIRNYIRRGKLWDAFVSDRRPVLLIDEIDKADIEFPNDLLLELDRMEFFVYETGETVKARQRPIVVITSNNEKELPDAFLRRCFFHYIRFPDPDTMRAIVDVHFPGIKQRLVAEALKLFYEIREVPGMKKKPSTSELLDWLKLLMVEDTSPETLRERDPKKLIPPLYGAPIKNEQDGHLFERVAFMARRQPRSPIDALRGGTADDASGPDQLVGREQAPGLVAFDDAAGDELAGHRRGVETVAAETARHPNARRDLADLRHAVYGAAERAGPQMRDLDFAERGKIAGDVAQQHARDPARIGLPHAQPPGPLQAIAADDAIVAVGALPVADRAAIAHEIAQRGAERFGHQDIGRERQQGGGESRHQRAESDIAG